MAVNLYGLIFSLKKLLKFLRKKKIFQTFSAKKIFEFFFHQKYLTFQIISRSLDYFAAQAGSKKFLRVPNFFLKN